MTLPLSCSFYNSRKVESKRKIWSLTHVSVRNRETTEGFYSGVLFLSSLLPAFHYKKIRPSLTLEGLLGGRL